MILRHFLNFTSTFITDKNTELCLSLDYLVNGNVKIDYCTEGYPLHQMKTKTENKNNNNNKKKQNKKAIKYWKSIVKTL